MRSSYQENNYKNVFKTLTFIINPKKIVEIGILDGYSLQSFLDSRQESCNVEAYDLFEDFPFNSAKYKEVIKKFKKYSNLKIEKSDFYEIYKRFKNNSIDILHVDIANNGDVIDFIIENYLPKIRKGGIIIVEGGSKERDSIEWMKKYKKKKIQPVLKERISPDKLMILEDFPSISIIKK